MSVSSLVFQAVRVYAVQRVHTLPCILTIGAHSLRKIKCGRPSEETNTSVRLCPADTHVQTRLVPVAYDAFEENSNVQVMRIQPSSSMKLRNCGDGRHGTHL